VLSPVTLTRRGDGPPLVELGDLASAGVDAVVTSREGGVSEAPYDSLNLGDHVGDDGARVVENRRRVAAAMGVDVDHLVIARQVHGRRVIDVDDWRGEALEGDALITSREDLALAVLVADCVPILLVEPQGRIAVAHAGWRGLASGVVGAVVERFTQPRALRAVIGPHISPARYQVGPEVAEHFAAVEGACRPDVGDRWRLDLGAVARAQLLETGVLEENVAAVALSSDDPVFYSDRRQRPCGRFALVARRRAYDAREMGGPR